MAKRALITGITGQNGSYLAEPLLSKGYEVAVRRVVREDPRETHSFHGFGELAFATARLDYCDSVEVDQRFYGCRTKARVRLGWQPQTLFHDPLTPMAPEDLRHRASSFNLTTA